MGGEAEQGSNCDRNQIGLHKMLWATDLASLRPDSKADDRWLLFPLLTPVDDYPTLFLLHCHKLEHKNMGMRLNFKLI